MKKLLRSIHHFISPAFQTLHLEYKVNTRPRYGHGKKPHALLNELIRANQAQYAELLTEFNLYKNEFKIIKDCSAETDNNVPCWNNNYFSGLDMISLYGMIRRLKPANYIEVGSGNSTKVVRKAITEGNLKTKITSIDPQPRAQIDHLADKVMRVAFENLNEYDFIIDTLNDGDVLFIDNSHRMFPNSDVTVFFLEILPYLKKGVIVHIHDIYLPYDYPQFMCDRFYNEQYPLAVALLSAKEKFEILLPCYFISEDSELKKILSETWHLLPDDIEQHGGSFWFGIRN